MIDPLVLSREGPPLIFAHANGYPPEAYRTFLNPFLWEFQVQAFYQRPFWLDAAPGDLKDWRDFRDDYLKFLENLEIEGTADTLAESPARIIGVGHSLGAMTILMAAITKPELFRGLVLIEPVLFPRWKGAVLRILAPFRLTGKVLPIIRTTRRRKVLFPTRASMYQNYREKSIFKKISDDVLWDYVSGLALENPDGSVSLRYSPAWEAKIYESAGIADRYVWRNLSRVACPVLIIRGEKSNTLTDGTLQKMAKTLPAGLAYTMPGAGHLVPLEAPQAVSAVGLDFLHSI